MFYSGSGRLSLKGLCHQDFADILSKLCQIMLGNPCFYTKCSHNTKRKISSEFSKEEEEICLRQLAIQLETFSSFSPFSSPYVANNTQCTKLVH